MGKEQSDKAHHHRFWAQVVPGVKDPGGTLSPTQVADECTVLMEELLKSWQQLPPERRANFDPLKRSRAYYLSRYGTVRAAERHLYNLMIHCSNPDVGDFKATCLIHLCEYAPPDVRWSA